MMVVMVVVVWYNICLFIQAPNRPVSHCVVGDDDDDVVGFSFSKQPNNS